MKTLDTPTSYRDGRDEMNLADFPISVLQRTQKTDGAEEARPAGADRQPIRSRLARPACGTRVTLTSTARDGLPTPADEHVILALLYVAKHGDDFASDTVHFAPSQLFDDHGLGAERPQLHAAARRAAAAEVADDPLRERLVGHGRAGVRGGGGDGDRQRLPDRAAGQRAAAGDNDAAKLGDVDAAVPRQPEGRQPQAARTSTCSSN